MCLSVPSQIIAIDDETLSVTVESLGVQRKVSRHLYMEPLAIGDYVLIHIGFVMNKIDKADAELSLALYQEMIDKLEAENGSCPV
ncbi:[NiFe] hydrogenase metallocenter assembly protein HypC [Photobacterium aphoticum]|uniref:[NiFe] hydrogenase metallocenter assembly protein HypC n=1 Tax=Photobacterium aphoticum TaxID=754436 RepID=A0A090QTQ0_9GAMM|nr:[NiFe] hydrogenase metallocenter assembly protein HypC [Photobacterium aphoticum]